jgi:hypothetical protein
MKKRIVKLGVNGFLFVLVTFFMFCNKKKEVFIEKKKFMPYFHTNIDMSKIDNILLIKFKNKKIKDSSNICIKYKFIDTGYETKWRFMLCDSFEVGYDYKIKLIEKNIIHQFLFEKINYDTIRTYKGYRYETKSYLMNGHKYINQQCDYFLISTPAAQRVLDKN